MPTQHDASALLIRLGYLHSKANLPQKIILCEKAPGKMMRFSDDGRLYRLKWFFLIPYRKWYTL